MAEKNKPSKRKEERESEELTKLRLLREQSLELRRLEREERLREELRRLEERRLEREEERRLEREEESESERQEREEERRLEREEESERQRERRLREELRQLMKSGYERALSEQGSVDVAYGRIMFLGSAGIGKTSLKRSLMKQPWDPNTTSTIVSDVSFIRHEWQTMSDENWREITHDDEMKELALLLKKSESPLSSSSSVAASELYPLLQQLPVEDISTLTATVQEIEQTNIDSILSQATRHYSSTTDAVQPFLNVWDCGGQPVFLEILPAFLTPRTAFLLLFDASRDFKERWQSVRKIAGQQVFEEEVNETTGDLMANWMSAIHGHLVRYNENGTLCEYPRIFCIGTHGDKLSEERKPQEVKDRLQSQCDGKAFSELIQDILVVDNTTSGKGEHEDPNITKLRNALGVFVREKLIVKTPVNWVLFRKVLQMYGKNVISSTEAHAIGVACKIPPADVPKVLMFYHEVGAVLFYPQIKGLQEKVIINPKWFVNTLGKIFTSEGSETGPTRDQWLLLHKKGILVQPLYVSIWKKCEDLDPESMMELLVHFRLAAPVHTKEYERIPNVKQYFLPAVLKEFKGDPQEAAPDHKLQATPLHITFSTGFVPPGFFTRLATTLARESTCKLEFDYGIHRNRVTFLHSQLDYFTLTDLHYAIQVDVLRYATVSSSVISFKSVCLELLKILEKCCQQVEETLVAYHEGIIDQSIKSVAMFRKFRYMCGCKQSSEPHYLKISQAQTNVRYTRCDKSIVARKLTDQESLWFEGETKEEHSPPAISSATGQSISILLSDTATASLVTSTAGQVNASELFRKEFANLAVAIEAKIDRAIDIVFSASFISKDVYDDLNTLNISAYKKAQKVVRELQRGIDQSKTSSDYLKNICHELSKLKDETIDDICRRLLQYYYHNRST